MKYTTKINNVDISEYIDDEGYSTTVSPVWSRKITTLDGVDHVVKIRDRRTVHFRLRAISAENLATVAALLLNAPFTFYGRILQSNSYITGTFIPDDVTATYLSKFLYGEADWNTVNKIVLTEL